MEPLRITILLNSPIVEPSQPFHFDALLGALKVRQAEAEHGAIDPRSVHHDIPLDRHVTPSGKWVFKASAFKLNKMEEAFNWMMSGRSDLKQAAEDRASGFLKYRTAKPNTAGGPFKASVFHLDLVWGDLVAYAVGDKQAIEQMLAGCSQVGGRRGTGFGNVQSISVESVSIEECHWDWRNLPSDYDIPLTHTESLVQSAGSLHAPYWDRQLHEVVLMPESL
ncbi:hypothetical protein ACI2KR_31090 [Pseudomonas luteola]